MADNSSIEWTEATWNPVTGCTKISAGCAHCYAERMAMRLQAMGAAHYQNGFQVTLHEDALEIPLRWKQPRRIFVNSMSDVFHESVPLEFIQKIFAVMQACPQHTFQVLTKRSQRLLELSDRLPWQENIWMGVTVENAGVIQRVQDLQKVPAALRFLSCEPLLGALPGLPLAGIHWVIVGGESGPGARPMKVEWVDEVLAQCQKTKVPFFFKQWGGTRKKRAGRMLHEQTYSEMPLVATSL